MIYQKVIFSFGRGISRFLNETFPLAERFEPEDGLIEAYLYKNWESVKDGETINEDDPGLIHVDMRPFIIDDVLFVPTKAREKGLSRLSYMKDAKLTIGVGHFGQYRLAKNHPGFALVPESAYLAVELENYGSQTFPNKKMQEILYSAIVKKINDIRTGKIVTVTSPTREYETIHQDAIGQDMETGIYFRRAKGWRISAGGLLIASDGGEDIFRHYDLRRLDGIVESNKVLSEYTDPRCAEPSRHAFLTVLDVAKQINL